MSLTMSHLLMADMRFTAKLPINVKFQLYHQLNLAFVLIYTVRTVGDIRTLKSVALTK